MPQGDANPIVAFMPLIMMFVIFYLLLIRPQQKKEKMRQAMINALKKGDKVTTSGGILGVVASVKETTIVMKVGESDTKLEVLKTAVSAKAEELKK